jgi:hypothetical protein
MPSPGNGQGPGETSVATELSASPGRYLYAIIPNPRATSAEEARPRAASAEEARPFPGVPECTGLGGHVVYPIAGGEVAAVVSDIEQGRIRPERRNLQIHYDVLKRLMEGSGVPPLSENAVLPMGFGIVADNSEVVRKILNFHQGALLEQLQRVAGKVEMSLKVSWNPPNVFAYLVNLHPELKEARDRLFRRGCDPSPDEKMELGRLFERVLNEDRARHSQTVLDVLKPLCFEVQQDKPRTERVVMDAACLVQRGAQAEFERGVFEAAKLFDDNVSFDFSGPFPPHSFVGVDLRL